MARDNPSWSQVLPFALLGLRTTTREQFAVCPASLMYGENLGFLGDLALDKGDCLGKIGLLRLLREAVGKMTPTPPSRHTQPVVNIARVCEVCTLVRSDACGQY